MRYLTAILILTAAPLAASNARVWQTVGEWTIRIGSDDASRCFASRVMDERSEVQIGTEPTLDGGYFAIYNASWDHIEDGAQGLVEFDFGTSRFGGDSFGKIENDVPGGYAFFNNPAFIQEFARRQTVTIIGKSGAEFVLDLTGTSSAIRGVLACQDERPEPDAIE